MGVRLSAGLFKRVVLAHYFDFHGRAGRAEFWNYAIILLVITLIAAIAVRLFSTASARTEVTPSWKTYSNPPPVTTSVGALLARRE